MDLHETNQSLEPPSVAADAAVGQLDVEALSVRPVPLAWSQSCLFWAAGPSTY